MQVDRLVFERAPQPLNEDVVRAPDAVVHRDADAGVAQAPGEDEAGELAALIGIEYLRRAVARQGLLQRVRAETRVSVFDSRQARTKRLAQSMTATR